MNNSYGILDMTRIGEKGQSACSGSETANVVRFLQISKFLEPKGSPQELPFEADTNGVH